MSKVSPFVFINDISFNKKNLFDEKVLEKEREKGNFYSENDYIKFITNRYFSFFNDTVHIANEANKELNNIPNKSHYEFYLYMISPKKRFTKWFNDETDEKVKFISGVYNISIQKAMEVVDLFSEEDLKELEQRFYCGGKNKSP